MKRFDIKYFIFISLIVLFGFLTPTELIAKSDYVKPTILHNPIEKMYESQPFIIEAIVTDNDELNDVIIYYRITGKSEFKYESMTLDFNNYQFEVPFEDIDSRGLEYYIMAIDNSDNRTHAPENDPEDYPYQVDYISFSSTSAPDALLLNPEDESHILLTVIEPDNPNYEFNKMHDLLYKKGYETHAMHGAISVMYDRKDWYPKAGFKNLYFYENLDNINTNNKSFFEDFIPNMN